MITFASLFVYIITAYGLSNIIVYSSGPFNLFSKIRTYSAEYLPSNLGEVFSCMICFPTWVGIFASLANYFLLPSINFTPSFLLFPNASIFFAIIIDACFTSGIVWLIDTLENYYEKNTLE